MDLLDQKKGTKEGIGRRKKEQQLVGSLLGKGGIQHAIGRHPRESRQQKPSIANVQNNKFHGYQFTWNERIANSAITLD